MSQRTKLILNVGGLISLVLAVAVVVSCIQGLDGIDASHEDPHELFKFYVQEPVPPGVTVHSAVGHANFGGTWITFRLKVDETGLDRLIAAKGLQRTDALQENLFTNEILAEMKRPEFYFTDKDLTWSDLGTGVRVVADRDTGVAFYLVNSP